jgi:hypothetical protein
VLATLAAAAERGSRATRKLWFDVASIADRDIGPEAAALLAKRLRQVGIPAPAAERGRVRADRRQPTAVFPLAVASRHDATMTL